MKAYQKIALITGLLTAPLCADTIVLKTGTKYQGKVISEDATNYLVEIQVTKSIKDERKIPKADVAEIIKESTEDIDFKKLGALVPTPDQLNEEDYQERIKKAKSFLQAHPNSTKAESVKSALTVLENEYPVIAEGGIKLNGKLIKADELKANAYDIHAQLLFKDFQKLSSQGLYQPALRKWERLSEDYQYSSAYVESIPQVKIVLQKYQSYLDEKIATLEPRMMKRKSVFNNLSANERQRIAQSVREQEERQKVRMEKEKDELKTLWLTVDPFDGASLKFNQRSARSELRRVTRLKPSTIKLVGPKIRSAWEALDNGDISSANKIATELKRLKVNEEYTGSLFSQLEEKKAMEKKAAMEQKEQEQKAALEKKERDRLAREAARAKKNSKNKEQN